MVLDHVFPLERLGTRQRVFLGCHGSVVHQWALSVRSVELGRVYAVHCPIDIIRQVTDFPKRIESLFLLFLPLFDRLLETTLLCLVLKLLSCHVLLVDLVDFGLVVLVDIHVLEDFQLFGRNSSLSFLLGVG